MTQIDTSTEAVEALLKDVTPGPWEVDWTGRGYWIGNSITIHDVTPAGAALGNFIAAARELVPALLQRAIAAEAERDALRAENELLKAQLAIQEYTIAKKAMNTIWNEALEQAATVQVRNGFDDRVMYELHPMLAAAIRALRQLEE